MKLEVHERLVLLALLPKEGGYADLKAIRTARECLSFTPEETARLEMRNEVNDSGKAGLRWNVEAAQSLVKDVPLDAYITNTIRGELGKLEKAKKLTDQHLSLYEKFILDYQ